MRKAIQAGIDPRAVHKSRGARHAAADVNGNFPPEARTYKSLLDSLEVGVAVANGDGRISYANPRFAEIMCGSSKLSQTLAGRDIRDFVVVSSWGQLSDALASGMERSVEGEMVVVAGNPGKQSTIHISFTPHFDGEERALRIVATEVTALVETKEALRRSEASLDTISARLLQVQDDERRKMARDLHDVTGQELAVAVMSLDNLKKIVNGTAPTVQQAINQSAELMRKVDGEIRTLSYLLHPPMLDEMGLGSALHWYVDGFSKRTGIQVEADFTGKFPRFATEVETAVFRVVQEALTNVFRHSGSHRAWVRLSAKPDQLEATVRDEGKGFDSNGVLSRNKASGVGIQSMKDRLRVFGGDLQFQSNARGTTVTAIVPTAAREELPLPAKRSRRSRAAEPDPAQVSAAPSVKKRILIVDDHEVARKGIRVLLKDQADLEICGEAKDGLEAIEQTRELAPDLIILDVSMPRMGGFAAMRHLKATAQQPKILIYTTHEHFELERVARAAGCDGFVVKSNASHDLIRGVRIVLQGGTFYSGSVSANAHAVSA